MASSMQSKEEQSLGACWTTHRAAAAGCSDGLKRSEVGAATKKLMERSARRLEHKDVIR